MVWPAAGGYVYTVRVADHSHYMDEGETYTLGAFPTWAEAVTAAKRVVDRSLKELHRPGMDAEAMFAQYTAFGEDPYIVLVADGEAGFFAWGHAEQRCAALCD
ncbi:hypothetical protein [Thermomonas flagellata]|uniref:hypothetical protein n=1 Tax=Thermomonas flagellata TaxID=2888524 RepID=UPI001F03896F|nr:hypothetical protein [Thermomonas flagellata]